MEIAAPLSRRALLRGGIGNTLGLGLAAAGLSLPGAAPQRVAAADPVVVGPTPKQLPTLPAFSAYHGVTGDEHQNRFNDLGGRGYVMISLSIYGKPDDPRYAAVWVLKPSVSQIGVHGVTGDEYLQRFNDAVARGYAPILISATGAVDKARFAAVFEQGVPGRTVTHRNAWFGSGPGVVGWFDRLDQAKADGLIPRSITVYGDNNGTYGAMVLQENTANAPWEYAAEYTIADFKRRTDTFAARGYRPSYLVISTSYIGIFRKDQVTPWEANFGQTTEEYQETFNDSVARGYMPICVTGAGNAPYTQYSSIFTTAAGFAAL